MGHGKKKCWRVKGQVMQDLVSYVKDFRLYPKGSDEQLKNSCRNKIIKFALRKVAFQYRK